MKDLKEALSSGRKPDITHARTPLLVYVARGCEYGDSTQGGKYIRANYLRPTEDLKADFLRYRAYLRAVVSHASQILDSLELHQAMDPDLTDVEGMKVAAYAKDVDAAPGCTVGASRLPHACGLAASINMVITQAVNAGLIPADPGQPWRKVEAKKEPELTEYERSILGFLVDREYTPYNRIRSQFKGIYYKVFDNVLLDLWAKELVNRSYSDDSDSVIFSPTQKALDLGL